MIEDFYMQIEDEFAKYVALLNEIANYPSLLSEIETDKNFLRTTKIVVATQFWRTPCQAKRVAAYSQELLSRYDSAPSECKELLGSDRTFIKYLQRRATKTNARKIIQFVLLPLITFDIWGNSALRCVSFREDSEKLVTCDRPVLFDDEDALFAFRKFLFPLSKNVLMMPTGFVGETSAEYTNELVFRRANKFVVSSSREQLEKMKSNMML